MKQQNLIRVEKLHQINHHVGCYCDKFFTPFIEVLIFLNILLFGAIWSQTMFSWIEKTVKRLGGAGAGVGAGGGGGAVKTN